jgi:predicted O-methyltransferase YrrM
MSFDDAKIYGDATEGFLQRDEGPLLYHVASQVKKGCIVEVGSWKGKSTVWIGWAIKDSKKKTPFYAVDPHTGSKEHQVKKKKVWTFDEFKTNIKNGKVTSVVKPLVMTSEQAVQKVQGPVGFVFIDGDHSLDAVKNDFTLWFPKVMVGGVMAFHDTTNWPGPKKVTRDLVYFSNHFKDVRFTQSITYATKVKRNTLKDQIKNRMHYYLKELYGHTSTLQLPVGIKKIGRKALDYFVSK